MSILRRLSALFPGNRLSAPVAEGENGIENGREIESTTVLIIGAGSTGLALAQGLKKAAIPTLVLEKAPRLSSPGDRDWNMGLHWGTDSLKALMTDNQWSRIQSAQVDPHTPTAEIDALKFLNGKTGEVMNEISARGFLRLRRRKLRELLVEGADVRFGHRLTGIEYSEDGETATAHFDSKPSISAQMIIGADGARSSTRSLLLGPENGSIRNLPYCATWVQATYTAEQALYLRSFHPLYLASINPDGYFSFFGTHDVLDPDQPETWVFFFYISWASSFEEQESTKDWGNKERLEQVKRFAKSSGFVDPWKSAFEWLGDGQEVWYMNLTDFDPAEPNHRWSTHGGRVTLAGDAAHAMTYQRGQGLNHSVTDAAQLCTAITGFVEGRKSREEAIGEYEEEMIERAGGEVRTSTMNTEMVHKWSEVLKSPVMRSGMTRVGEDKKNEEGEGGGEGDEARR